MACKIYLKKGIKSNIFKGVFIILAIRYIKFYPAHIGTLGKYGANR